MHDERAAPFTDLVPEARRFKSFHVIEPDGTAHSTGSAVIAMLSLLERTRRLGTALAALQMRRLVDVVYWMVSTNRAFLGRFVRDAPGPVRLDDRPRS